MKFRVQYTTNERKYITESMYNPVEKTIEIEPIAIKRASLCRVGAKKQRYSYQAVFLAPPDAEFKKSDGTCISNIVRMTNPHFDPKELVFINNICVLCEEQEANK